MKPAQKSDSQLVQQTKTFVSKKGPLGHHHHHHHRDTSDDENLDVDEKDVKLKAWDSYFRPRYGEAARDAIRWPAPTGEEWDSLAQTSNSRLVRYMEDWEEYELRHCKTRFWRCTVLAEREVACRRIQRMVRQFRYRPAPAVWFSKAHSWHMPRPKGSSVFFFFFFF